MSFLIKNDELLEKYKKIWDKVSNSIKKGFENKPVCNEKSLKTKIKSYDGKINTNLHDDKLLKKGSYCICLSVIIFCFYNR